MILKNIENREFKLDKKKYCLTLLNLWSGIDNDSSLKSIIIK